MIKALRFDERELLFYVEKARSGDVYDWESDLVTGMNDIDSKGIHSIATDVITIYTRNQHLALVIVHENTTDHFYLTVSYRCLP
jgi:hypothetical protein